MAVYARGFIAEGRGADMNPLADFFQSMNWGSLQDFLLRIAAVLLCIIVHEVSHGLAAYCLGDPTAKERHRLSLNPIRHIDPFGLLMMVVAGFGWAKPVPVDMRYFKHPKSGMAITALAGPMSNFLLAYVALLLRACIFPFLIQSGGTGILVDIEYFLVMAAILSIGLGIFNLIPFPPLDGSKILGSILPDRLYYTILRYEQIGMFVLMALLWTGAIDAPLMAARTWVLDGLLWASRWPFDLISSIL